MTRRITPINVEDTTHYARLTEILNPGSDIAFIIRSLARSGMSRKMSVFTTRNGRIIDITKDVADTLGYTVNADWHMHVNGCGMNMPEHITSLLTKTLFGPDAEYDYDQRLHHQVL